MSRAERILALLKAEPLTPEQLATKLHEPRDMIQDSLLSLKSRNLAKRVDARGHGKGAVWGAIGPDIPIRKPSTPTAWTPEAEAKIKALWLDGVPASAIEATLGGLYSRSAITGKLGRMGILGTVQRANMDRGLKQRIEARQRREGRQKAAQPVAAPTATKAPPVVETASSAGVMLLALLPWHCRWITQGSGEFAVFCACRHTEGSVYCEPHRRMSVTERPADKRHMRLERWAS
jgi:hypothetical protein